MDIFFPLFTTNFYGTIDVCKLKIDKAFCHKIFLLLSSFMLPQSNTLLPILARGAYKAFVSFSLEKFKFSTATIQITANYCPNQTYLPNRRISLA